MRFAAGGAGGVAGSAAASVTDLAALGAQRHGYGYGYGEVEAVSDEDMPEDFGLSGR